MRYIVFASDYDGTLASDGRVDDATTKAVENLKASGRKLFLVTGRHLDDIKEIFPKLDLFDRVVAENGAVVYSPATREEKVLTPLPPQGFLDALRAEKIPFAVGRSIISSWTPNEVGILDVIRRQALDYQVIFNKGAVMVLPSGVNKATGLLTALKEMGLSPHNTVAIGDSIGTHSEGPEAEMVAKALNAPQIQSIVVNLMAIPLNDRPAKFAALLQKIIETRAQTARPHWLVVDEAHHLMPTGSSSFASSTLPQELGGMILITVHPEHIAVPALALVDAALITGDSAAETLSTFANAVQAPVPKDVPAPSGTGEALVWFLHRQQSPMIIKTLVAKAERRRHRRNYAQGELSPQQSFYFRGADSKLNLRAQNLTTFLQLSDGVDDDTWLYHLHKGDYSQWFESVIKDADLASAARDIEREPRSNVSEDRAKLKQAIENRYTAPA